ncbi:hypothetical protein VFC49_06945 [Thermococcus sp. SY098]|uniref:hypothetical protein n=1 Tax=Thermococcus sp. SY098 TaxID=3111325 RepID=UPI002D79C0D7|nr:hypothetical protein [Thermococcus sp. SY098]WRS51822.1 hypothetical protein VFC49_06945 [Thermococcus sp. SY098]
MPRPRKKQDGKITTVYLERWALEKVVEISKETGLSLGDLIEIWLTKEERVVRMVAEYEGLKKHVVELEKLVSNLEEKLFKTQQENEKLCVENQALKEENKELKQRIRELERQLKMSARERRAEDFKKEIYEVIDRYSRDGKIKMVELMKRLGYSGELLKHAKEFLEQWFVKEGKVYVSYELGLVIIPHHKFGELAWEVRRLPSSSNPTSMEVVE